MTADEYLITGKYLRNEERLEEAYRYILEAALAGQPDAIKQVGAFYLHGAGVRQEFRKAFHYLQMSYDLLGDTSILHHMIAEHENIVNDSEARQLYAAFLDHLIEKREWEALIIKGEEYSPGGIYPADTGEKIRCFEQAISHGVNVGAELLGEMYFLGTEVEQDYEKAYKYFTAREGFTSFAKPYYLGRMYEEGLFVERDLGAAAAEYEKIVNASFLGRSADLFYGKAGERLARLRKMQKVGTGRED